MVISATYFKKVIQPILDGNVVKATQYLTPKLIIRATRRLFNKTIDKRDPSFDFVMTVGRPNYAERDFIKKCQQVGEPFPIKKVQLKLYKTPKR